MSTDADGSSTARSGGVQSLERAFGLLETMADAGGTIGLSQLAAEADLPLPTIHRLVRTLVDLGYVRQEPSRQYALGPRLIRLGETSSRMLGTWARPYLLELVEGLGESANLAMLDGDLMVYVGQVQSRQSMRMFTEVGRAVSAHCTAVGKAILAGEDPAAVRALLARTGMEARTEHTLTDPDALAASPGPGAGAGLCRGRAGAGARRALRGGGGAGRALADRHVRLRAGAPDDRAAHRARRAAADRGRRRAGQGPRLRPSRGHTLTARGGRRLRRGDWFRNPSTTPRSTPVTSTAARDLASEHVDVLIVGAGLSGIGAAYRLQQQCPGRSYAVLEAREAVGGTWDLFRYPGVRSDSDIFTLSYPFRPWRDATSLADGASIREYIARTATEEGIREHIRFRTKVVDASWSSAEARWTVRTLVGEDAEPQTMTCSFLYVCAGYYDYDHGHQPDFAGVEDFGGRLVHPQFWPEDLDVDGLRIVVIGSGATAVTLVPALAGRAANVTMLQRTPSYVSALPAVDQAADALRRHLPAGLAHTLIRAKNVGITQAFYQFCRRRPELAKRLLRKGLLQHLDDPAFLDEHFTPPYDPWDQRLCVTPDGDLLQAVAAGRADVVTDTIDRFVGPGIRLSSGRTLEADIVVSATGLSLLPIGGMTPDRGRRAGRPSASGSPTAG